jgi:16S rRNA (guanine966-N2)-methyltransferase
MRITGGSLRGRVLIGPQDETVRPTSDKVRQAIFNLLEHHPAVADFTLQGVRVLDLFAGTGALGLEAISRGASYCLFVDDSTQGRALVRRNVEALGLTGVTKLWRRNAASPGRLDTLSAFGLAFLDPPYGKGLIEPALIAMQHGGWLLPDAIIAAESHESETMAAPEGYLLLDRRIYGDTAVTLLRTRS